MLKIATWNICLGLKNKKDYVSSVINEHKIDICCLQEVDLETDYPSEILSFKNYSIEVETNDYKARVAVYIKNGISRHRRHELEGTNSNVIVIDLDLTKKYRLINLYRLFNPPNNVGQVEHFANQINIIKNTIVEDPTRRVIVVGDFNLDDAKKYCVDYKNRNLFNILNIEFDSLDLIQTVTFPTWTRLINNSLKSSILDHIYTRDITLVNNIQSVKPLIGDHLLLTFNINETPAKPMITVRRNWQFYNKAKLLQELEKEDFNCNANSVQEFWNNFENKLVTIADRLVPLETFTNNATVKSQIPPPFIKNKINVRKRLLKSLKITKSPEIRNRIKNLNHEIKNYFICAKRKNVRRGILPGNSKSLWKAVNIAKDTNTDDLPPKMFLNNVYITNEQLPDVFAEFFDSKIENIIRDVKVENNVYNGKKMVQSSDVNFMCENDIIEAVMHLKIKNCEGHDRIPQRLLTDGIHILIKPLTVLFSKIYMQMDIPQQWLFSKIAPVPKKGIKSKIENYRPIANLCSTTKIFEKLILQRILQIEKDNNVDITGPQQHGFKKGHSTNTAGLALQTIIASALDEDSFALMASIDLSAAFDLVNIELLLKRMKIMGLPNDIMELVKKWLTLRYYYVSIKGNNSYVHLSRVGTIQGSILGPILYAIYTSPLFDLQKMTSFADDTYIVRWNKTLTQLIIDMQKSLEMITKWLKQSGLKVNDSKTELCLFHRKSNPLIEIIINNITIKSKHAINVLGIEFDSKLQWNTHVSKTISKAKKANHAIRLVRKYFNKHELNQLLTANFYSILYYNSDIWHIPSLSIVLKKQLLAASASALKICTPTYNLTMSYQRLHLINGRATPLEMMKYKHALLLFKTYNTTKMSKDWLALNFQQNFNNRNTTINLVDTSQFKIGKNLIPNRLLIVNRQIDLELLNLSYLAYKIKCKNIFLCGHS